MKKLIIIDTDDEKWTHAKVSLAYKDDDGMWADVNYETLPLRSMPNKKDTVRDEAYSIEDYRIGYNYCLDEILGENV